MASQLRTSLAPLPPAVGEVDVPVDEVGERPGLEVVEHVVVEALVEQRRRRRDDLAAARPRSPPSGRGRRATTRRGTRRRRTAGRASPGTAAGATARRSRRRRHAGRGRRRRAPRRPPSPRAAQRAERRQRRGEAVDDERHDGQAGRQHVLDGVGDAVVDLQAGREGDVELGGDEGGEQRPASSGSVGCGPAGVPCSPAPDHVADADRERRHEVEPEAAEVVGADDDGDVGAGVDDRLRGPRRGRRGRRGPGRGGRPRPTWCSSASCATPRHRSPPCSSACHQLVARARADVDGGRHEVAGEQLEGGRRRRCSCRRRSRARRRRRCTLGRPTRTVGMPRLRRMLASVAPLVAAMRLVRRRRSPPPTRRSPRGRSSARRSVRLPGMASASSVRTSIGSVAVAQRRRGRRRARARASSGDCPGTRRRSTRSWATAGTTAAIRHQPALRGADDPLRLDAGRWRGGRRTSGTTPRGGRRRGRRRRSGCGTAAGGGRRRRCGCRRR